MSVSWADMMASKGRDIPKFVYYVVADSYSLYASKVYLVRVTGEKPSKSTASRKHTG